MTCLIKLGGSLITDKRKARSFRPAVARSIARQLADLRRAGYERPIVLGHGSGSFGHVEARKHDTHRGVFSEADRLGFARVGAAAAELSLLLLRELLAADLPAMRFQPSATLIARNGRVEAFDERALKLALERGMLPLTHGDIALDEARGGAIVSTEALFVRLATRLDAREIVLLGEVDGVLDSRGELITEIEPASLPGTLGGSSGVDVTGGMLGKVEAMMELTKANPAATVTIANGNRPEILLDLLLRRREIGTRIRGETARQV